MRNDERRIDVARIDLSEQWSGITFHVGLAHLHRQAFIHRSAHRHFIEEAAINARDRDGAAFTATHNRFSQYMRAIGR